MMEAWKTEVTECGRCGTLFPMLACMKCEKFYCCACVLNHLRVRHLFRYEWETEHSREGEGS